MVAATTWSNGFGGYTEHICLPARDLVSVPAGVDPAQAVCVVVNYLTAHVALHRVAHVRSGQRALIHGAGGGVGSALVQLGRLAGLELLGTASARDHALLRELGVTPIDYHTEDFVARVREVTGDGVDVAFDPIGGAGHIRRSYRALRRGGCLVWFGVAAVARSGFRVIPASVAMNALLMLLPDGKRAPFFPTLDKLAASEPDWYRETLEGLLRSLAAGEISPLVAARVPLTDAARAHEMLEAGGHPGKVVLVTES
jgi:NADPH:quinone reductase-like Zn-dependent oxidoreductase